MIKEMEALRAAFLEARTWTTWPLGHRTIDDALATLARIEASLEALTPKQPLSGAYDPCVDAVSRGLLDSSVLSSAQKELLSEESSNHSVYVAAPPARQPQKLEDIEQYRMQMAGISTAATGYWKEGDSIHPDYDTPALRDVAKLYAKYDALYKAQQPQYEAGDMASAHNDGFRAGVASVAQQPQAEAVPRNEAIGSLMTAATIGLNSAISRIKGQSPHSPLEPVEAARELCIRAGEMAEAAPQQAEAAPCGNRDYCGRFPFCGCGDSDALPERDKTKPAEQQGLFRKFVVRRTDGSDGPGGKHEGCEYFVLDVTHDKHATAALAAYAASVEETHPQLAADMRVRYGLAAPQQAEAVHNKPVRVCHIKDVACSEAAVKCGECPDAAPQQAETVPSDVVRDAERWRTFLATRPANTHAVIIQAVDDAATRKGGGV